MQVYQLQQPENLGARSHPWVSSLNDPSHRYEDFVTHPERIRESLEDLVDWRAYRSTETLFRLIERLNGPDSALMTNDCAFNSPAPHAGQHSDRRLEASGRVSVLFRDLELNTEPARIEALTQRVAVALEPMEPGFSDGAIAASIVDVNFTTLQPPAPGKQLLLSFWSWGDDVFETLFHLDRTLISLSAALP